MKKNYKYGIILPLKETFLTNNAGAVSIFVNQYLLKSKLKKKTIVYTKDVKGSYLQSNVRLINLKVNLFTNYNYIKKISKDKFFENLSYIEIHNRPYYAEYLLKNFPDKKIILFLHNEFLSKNNHSNNSKKVFLLKNCSSIIFVSKYLKDSFFQNLEIKDRNNAHIIYNTISKAKKFNFKKKKNIIFAGKLNKSKGFDIFGKSILKILDKYPNWNAHIIGNEKRENYNFLHKNLIFKDWISHKKLINLYDKSSISVVNPTWNEPFGRTALESSSRGCAVITSKSGGLNETFSNNLILKENNSFNLTLELDKLISNNKLLKKIQKANFTNQIISEKDEIKKIDNLKLETFNKYEKLINKYNILHIGVFGEKQNFRTYNLSLASKISNGFIRNGHHVINYDYRSKLDKNSNFNKIFRINDVIDEEILNITNNYKPDLVLFGHNNILKRKSLLHIKNKVGSKIAIWYEDHVTKNDPNAKKNLDLIEKNNDLFDNYFITTHPSCVKTIIDKKKLRFLPMPVDDSVEKLNLYNQTSKNKDLFFAISHGVNRGVLKEDHYDNRIIFVNNLIKNNNTLKYQLLGFNYHQPKWNDDLYNEMKKCNFALNLSRGGPYKYTSSNRIATYVGNGMATCVDEKLKFSDFFSSKEMIFYKNEVDLIKKLEVLKKKPNLIKSIARKGKNKYFKLFNNLIISDYILSKSLNFKSKFKFVWDK